ncbi:TonB-dependent siderophore receptor [Salinimonas sediminis]|uniref:TonB-dependent siderophore receptor n=1 Tax=Salinimonas sediminis TaxID=2303538 RepID=UPI001E5F99E2|nr:TonB-dependent receptor [Salinimonas sediminis]
MVLEYGSFNKKQVNVDVGSRLTEDEKWLGRVVGIYRDADTQVDYVNDDTRLLMPSVSYSPSDATRLTVIGLFQDTNSDTAAQFVPIEGTLEPLADGSYLPDQDVYAGEPGFNKYDTKSSQLTVLGEHAFNDTTELTFTALWRDGEADYHQAWPLFTGTTRYINAFLGAPVVGTETTVARTFYTADNTFKQQAVDIRLSKTFDTGAFEHVILAGVQYQDVETDNNFSYYTDGGVSAGDFRYVLDLANPVYTGAPDQAVFDALYTDGPLQTVKDVGLYLSDQIAYDNWRITLGVRQDSVDNDNGSVSQDDSQTSYSAGVLYKFANGLSPYVSYAESFETVVGLDMLGNQLEPETGRQYEAGIKYAFNAIPGFVTLAWYDIEIANLPNPNALPVTASQQQGIATINGVELESRIVLGEFTAELNASVMDAQDPNGFELPGQPDSNASLWLTWEPSFGDGLRMGAGLRYVGQSVAENTAVRYATPDYTLADLMLEKPLSDNLIARLNVRNLTDKEYLTSCLTRGDCFPGVRRNINASLTYQF